jgi:hypothetical protein
VKPHWAVVPWHISHPICRSRPSLCCQFHVAFDLLDVGHELGVRYNVISRLIVEQVPGTGYAVIRLREHVCFVDLIHGSVFTVFGALLRTVGFEGDLVEEGVVGGLVWLVDHTPVDGIDELTEPLVVDTLPPSFGRRRIRSMCDFSTPQCRHIFFRLFAPDVVNAFSWVVFSSSWFPSCTNATPELGQSHAPTWPNSRARILGSFL